MTLRRAVVSFLTLTIAGAAGRAQAQTSISVGLLGGAAMAKISGPNVSTTEPNLSKSRVGFMAGAALTFGISPNFAIEPELLYVQKGVKPGDADVKGSLKMTYVEVPLLAKVRIPAKGGGKVSPHFYAGPWMAFKVGCSGSFTVGTTKISEKCGAGDLQEVNYKSTDMGLAAGAGVDIGRAMIGVRYDYGVYKMGHSGNAAGLEVKTRAFYILAGFSFPTHH